MSTNMILGVAALTLSVLAIVLAIAACKVAGKSDQKSIEMERAAYQKRQDTKGGAK